MLFVLQCTASDYPFGIFKISFQTVIVNSIKTTERFWLGRCTYISGFFFLTTSYLLLQCLLQLTRQKSKLLLVFPCYILFWLSRAIIRITYTHQVLVGFMLLFFFLCVVFCQHFFYCFPFLLFCSAIVLFVFHFYGLWLLLCYLQTIHNIFQLSIFLFTSSQSKDHV